MGLTGEQRQNLREALISAFPKQADLELMFEDEFDQPFNSVTQERPNYELTVQDLVKWAEAEGKLIDLAIRASRKNPGNPRLRSFIENSLTMLLTFGSDHLETNCLASLTTTLQKIQDIGLISSCCRQVWIEIYIHRPKVLKDLENLDLSFSVKWLVILRVWLKEYKQSPDGTPCIIDFVDRLRQHPDCPNAQKQILTSLVAKLRTEVGYTLPTPSTNCTPDHAQIIRSVQGYFLITVQFSITEEEGSDRIFIKGFLAIKTDGQDSPSKLVPLQDLIVQNSASSISGGEQSGISSTLQQLEQQFPQWVNQAEERLTAECCEIQKVYSLPMLPTYKLIIEFFLPYEYLAEAVDLWQVSRPVLRRREMVAVGRKHRVVVRSSDRLQDSELLNRLNHTWKWIEIFLQNSPTQELLEAKLGNLDNLNSCEIDALIQRFKQCLGLKLLCPLCVPEAKLQRETVFLAVLEAGLPIVLWSRRHDLPNLSEELESLLVLESLFNLERLVEQVYEKRGSACTDTDLGQHLAILCDEPKRIERLRQFFNEGRLSA